VARGAPDLPNGNGKIFRHIYFIFFFIKISGMKAGALMLFGAFILSVHMYSQDPNFHIYLCFGQSNMEGQDTIEEQDLAVDSRFQVMQADQGGVCASMNPIIATLPDTIPTAFVISSSACRAKDRAHFNSEGYREMGRPYAEKMLHLYR
jgi:hypothetical protein